MSDTLTKKQSRILDLAERHNGDAKKVAKSAKITVNGVYGHFRRIREKGHTIPGDGNGGGNGGTNGTPANGIEVPTIASIVESVSKTVDAAIAEAEQEQARLQEVEDAKVAEADAAVQAAKLAERERVDADDRLASLRSYREKVAA